MNLFGHECAVGTFGWVFGVEAGVTAVDEDASPAFAPAFFVGVDVKHLLFGRALGKFVLWRTRTAFLRFRFCRGKTKRSTAVDKL